MGLLRWLFGLALAVVVHVLGLRLSPELTQVLDPFLILVAYHSLGRDPAWSLLGGTAAGLAQDALTGGLFGLHGFANTVVAFFCTRLQQRFVTQQPLQVALLFALAAALQLSLLALLQFLFLSHPELPQPLPAVGKMLTTGVLGLALYLVNRRLRSWLLRTRRLRQRKLTLDKR